MQNNFFQNFFHFLKLVKNKNYLNPAKIIKIAAIQTGYRPIELAGRVFVSGPGHWSSVPDRVITKTQKIVLDTSLFNSQNYKVRIKSKVEQTSERSSAFPTLQCRSY